MPQLSIDLVANVARLQKDMEKATQTVDRGFKGMQRAAEQVKTVFASLFTAYTAIRIASFVKSQVDAADQLSKLSQRLGITVENLSAYQYAASLAGGSSEDLTSAMGKLANSMQEALITKTAKSALIFKGLNIDILDSSGNMRDLNEVFKQFAVRISEASDGTAKLATVQGVLGKSAGVLIPFINDMGALTEEARRTGNVIGDQFAKDAEKFNDSITRMEAGTARLARTIAAPLLPALTDFIEKLTFASSIKIDFGAIGPSFITKLTLAYAIAREKNKQFLELQKQDIDAIFLSGVSNILDRVKGQEKQFKIGGIISPGPERNELPAVKPEDTAAAAREKALAAKILTIHQASIAEEIKLAEKYVTDYQTLNEARAAGVIKTDKELQLRRLELQEKYKQDILDLEVKNAGDDKLSKEIAKDKARNAELLKARTEQILESTLTEREAEEAAYAAKLDILTQANLTIIEATEEANAMKLLSDEDYHAAREQLELEHLARMGDMNARSILDGQKFLELSNKQKVQNILATGTAMTASVATSSKTMFNLNKAFALANAAVALPDAVLQSFQRGGGYPWGLIPAGLMLATGLAQIQQIKSAQFGGSTSAASIGGGGAVPTTNVGASIDTGQNLGQPPQRDINLFIQSDSGMVSVNWLRDQFMPAWNEAVGDGVRVNLVSQ